MTSGPEGMTTSGPEGMIHVTSGPEERMMTSGPEGTTTRPQDMTTSVQSDGKTTTMSEAISNKT